MKVQIAKPKEAEEPKVSLEFTEYGNEVFVKDKEKGWAIISFKVVEGKVRLVRYGGVNDERFATDKKGRILETAE
jgi:hypothetical protein